MPPKTIPKLTNSQPIKLIKLSTPQPLNHVLIFLLAFTLLLSFWQVGLLLNDEWITANQLTNLKHGSLTVDEIKYGTDRGIYNIGGKPVGAYTHALPVFALPFYYALAAVNHIINLRLFFIFVWLFAVCALIYYYRGTRRTKYVLAFLTFLFFAANLILYFVPAMGGQRQGPFLFWVPHDSHSYVKKPRLSSSIYDIIPNIKDFYIDIA